LKKICLDQPSEKQKLFLAANTKHVGFGGARGGGKSWAVRTKAILLCLRYPGISLLIVRRTYPELIGNHINILRPMLKDIARYNDSEKLMRFENGSSIRFCYCAKDSDLDRLQGMEYDIIFLDEATQLSEFQMKSITATLRGVNDFPKRVYYTCNPGGRGHSYLKRIFIDRRYEEDEDPAEYTFIQSFATDNHALMAKQPDYLKQLRALPPALRAAWLEGRWDVFEGQFFEEFRLSPDPERCLQAGISVDEAAAQRRFTHVIKPFDLDAGTKAAWHIYRSYDFGYHRPFSVGYYAVDPDGVIYRIAELYGSNGMPNEGQRCSPDEQFSKIAAFENSHPLLRGKTILCGIADPSIWDASRGVSIAETAAKYGIYFTPGDNKRIPGCMR